MNYYDNAANVENINETLLKIHTKKFNFIQQKLVHYIDVLK